MLSSKNAKAIVQDSDIKEGLAAKTLKFAGASKSVRQNLIQRNADSEEGRICAAIEIQRVFRGFCTRCRLMSAIGQGVSKTALYGESKHDLQQRLKDFESAAPIPAGLNVRERLQYRYNDLQARRKSQGEKQKSFSDFCAEYIQSWWKNKSDPAKSSIKLAPKTRTPLKPPPKKRDILLSEDEAAIIIQKSWRRHIDIQVYHYYRDLINFKQRGDPMMMLRCINPNEARMLDAASGIHIKFRLAGERFPPNIYYKIFTHRPIQDLCANSPKDYTGADAKRLMARDVHNKGHCVPQQDNSGWYVRSENNGWRLVSDRMLRHILADPVTWETTNKKMEFHHNRLQRRQDVERKRKSKKIEWMQKMYHEGMLNAKVADEETVRLIEGAAAGMVATIERQGEEAVQDWEVDELLEWTTSLNFEDYCKGWKEIATSANSEKAVEDRLNLVTNDLDPFDISLKMDLRDGSTRQSHNSPASSRSASTMMVQ